MNGVDLHALLDGALPAEARTWLDGAVEKVATEASAIRVLFPAVRRRCGHGRLNAQWTVDEAARVVLISAIAPAARTAEMAALYRRGERGERRAVLMALSPVDDDGGGLTLVRDALRSNDSALIEAALGPFGAGLLPIDEYRQAVLKCVFSEIPLDRIEGLPGRADGELARMLADFARERVAAGRPVPTDIWPIVRAFPDTATALHTAITAETTSTVPARQAAAVAALVHLTKRADVAHL